MLKIDRICNLKRKEVSPENESVKDTVVDLHNYIDLLYGCLIEKSSYSNLEEAVKCVYTGEFNDKVYSNLENNHTHKTYLCDVKTTDLYNGDLFKC